MIYLVKLFQHEKLLKHTNLVVARNQKKVYNQFTHGEKLINFSALKLLFFVVLIS